MKKSCMRLAAALLALLLCLLPLSGLAEADAHLALPGLEYESSMPLRYANQFSVDYYSGGYKLITVSGAERYLVVSEGAEVPEGLEPSIAVLQQPLDNIYLAASAAMASPLSEPLGTAMRSGRPLAGTAGSPGAG